jgi:para-aminobenzoate synthetase component 1
LLKEGLIVTSQPIKGTCRRGDTEKEDLGLKANLLQDEKERAENVMIVDLVRNDLSQTCETETVAVEELFGIYSYQYVHQMISTITGKIPSQLETIECIKKAFPMGSMTGAPKLEVIKNIEKLEKSARGLYSGSVGYIDPNGDFDFNVVIRSLIYDQVKAKLSYHVGGAITYDSIPENEYEECLLKAKGITSLFD